MNEGAESVARVYTLWISKEGEERIQYIGCTLKKLDKKLLEHTTKCDDFFYMWANERGWDLNTVTIQPVNEFKCTSKYAEPYQYIPLNYDTKNAKDMGKYKSIVKHFVSRCIESMNK
jgi:hypothetical protein